MTARFTGPGRKAVRGNGAASHPQLSEYISKARKVAGILINQMKLGEIWSGVRYARIAEDAVVKVQILNNIDGLEPIVNMELFIEREPVEEDEQEVVTSGFVLQVLTDSSQATLFSVQGEGTGVIKVSNVAKKEWKMGCFDWVSPDGELFTWGDYSSPTGHYRYSAPMTGRDVYSRGEVVASIDESIGDKIVGVAQESGDLVVIASRFTDGAESLVVYRQQGSEWKELHTGTIPHQERLTQNVFFNETGTEAVGLCARTRTTWVEVFLSLETGFEFVVRTTSVLAHENDDLGGTTFDTSEDPSETNNSEYNARLAVDPYLGELRINTNNYGYIEEYRTDNRTENAAFLGLQRSENAEPDATLVDYFPIAVDFNAGEIKFVSVHWPENVPASALSTTSLSYQSTTVYDTPYITLEDYEIFDYNADNPDFGPDYAFLFCHMTGTTSKTWTASGSSQHEASQVQAEIRMAGENIGGYTVPMSRFYPDPIQNNDTSAPFLVSASATSSGTGELTGGADYYVESDLGNNTYIGSVILDLAAHDVDDPEYDTFFKTSLSMSAFSELEATYRSVNTMVIAADIRNLEAVVFENDVTLNTRATRSVSQSLTSEDVSTEEVSEVSGSRQSKIKHIYIAEESDELVTNEEVLREWSHSATLPSISQSGSFTSGGNTSPSYAGGVSLASILSNLGLRSFGSSVPRESISSFSSPEITIAPSFRNFWVPTPTANDGTEIDQWASTHDAYGNTGVAVRLGKQWDTLPSDGSIGVWGDVLSVYLGPSQISEDEWFAFFASEKYAADNNLPSIESVIDSDSVATVFMTPIRR